MLRSLDPAAVADPITRVYPDDLDTITVQGYLGEIFAGLIAENYEPHGEAWTVPAFLFGGHILAKQTLERRRQLGGPVGPIPGRTGDDSLALQMGDDGRISAWLFAEAKCTDDHNATLISAGHKQLSTQLWLPLVSDQLVNLLYSRNRGDDARWAAALQELFLVEGCPKLRLVWTCLSTCAGGRPRRSRPGSKKKSAHSLLNDAGPPAGVHERTDSARHGGMSLAARSANRRRASSVSR